MSVQTAPYGLKQFQLVEEFTNMEHINIGFMELIGVGAEEGHLCFYDCTALSKNHNQKAMHIDGLRA